jgi:hypothetical protein
MATLKIHPIEVYSKGRHRVVISGISPLDENCFVGDMWNGLDGPIPSVWDIDGVRRGGSREHDLDMDLDELKELSELTTQLGAMRYAPRPKKLA